MKFENASQVKKWLRLLPVAKKEMKAKIDMYSELIADLKELHTARRSQALTATAKRSRRLGISLTA